MTQPTTGLGKVLPAAVAASASARRELASFLLEERAVEDLMGSLAF